MVGVAAGLVCELVRLRRADGLLVRRQLDGAELRLLGQTMRLVMVVRVVTVLQAVQQFGPAQRRAHQTLPDTRGGPRVRTVLTQSWG